MCRAWFSLTVSIREPRVISLMGPIRAVLSEPFQLERSSLKNGEQWSDCSISFGFKVDNHPLGVLTNPGLLGHTLPVMGVKHFFLICPVNNEYSIAHHTKVLHRNRNGRS